MPGPRDTEPFGSAHDQVELQAAEAIGMSRGRQAQDPRVRASPPRPAAAKTCNGSVAFPRERCSLLVSDHSESEASGWSGDPVSHLPTSQAPAGSHDGSRQ
jgi:hypothetical protein